MTLTPRYCGAKKNKVKNRINTNLYSTHTYTYMFYA